MIYYFLYVSCAFGGRVEECNKKSQLFDWCHLFLQFIYYLNCFGYIMCLIVRYKIAFVVVLPLNEMTQISDLEESRNQRQQPGNPA